LEYPFSEALDEERGSSGEEWILKVKEQVNRSGTTTKFLRISDAGHVAAAAFDNVIVAFDGIAAEAFAGKFDTSQSERTFR